MFLIQEIPSINVGFGFAVELFFLTFSVFCWLITPETFKISPVEKHQAVSESTQDLNNHYLKYMPEILEALSFNEAQKIVSG